jgi:hypothetical protein
MRSTWGDVVWSAVSEAIYDPDPIVVLNRARTAHRSTQEELRLDRERASRQVDGLREELLARNRTSQRPADLLPLAQKMARAQKSLQQIERLEYTNEGLSIRMLEAESATRALRGMRDATNAVRSMSRQTGNTAKALRAYEAESQKIESTLQGIDSIHACELDEDDAANTLAEIVESLQLHLDLFPVASEGEVEARIRALATAPTVEH